MGVGGLCWLFVGSGVGCRSRVVVVGGRCGGWLVMASGRVVNDRRLSNIVDLFDHEFQSAVHKGKLLWN